MSLKHYLNPLHVYCRLLDIGFGKPSASWICKRYQRAWDKINKIKTEVMKESAMKAISRFRTGLYVTYKTESAGVWILTESLIYDSEMLGKTIEVPAGFNTDFASVPRVPIIYSLWGDRAHREAVLHDYLYRTDSNPILDRKTCDQVFLEAMASTGKPWYIRAPMYIGVRIGGGPCFCQRMVFDVL